MKSEKGECSAPLYISKLIRAEDCVRFRLYHLCLGVKEGCLLHDKRDSDKTVHFAACTSFDYKLKNQNGALHLRFSLFCTILEKLFLASIYRTDCSVFEVSYPCLLHGCRKNAEKTYDYRWSPKFARLTHGLTCGSFQSA